MKFLPLIALCPSLLSAAPAGSVIFVDDSAPGPVHDGASWATAYTALQEALAHPGLAPGNELWVAEGTYRPDRGRRQTPGDRTATFQVPDGVALYGGFDGRESSLEERAGLFHQTVLSGDLLGDDGPGDLLHDDNSYHVVTAVNVGASTLLDGFRITAGYAVDFTILDGGAGLLLEEASLTVRNCAIVANTARGLGFSLSGGGVASRGSFDLGEGPTFEDCDFEDNRADGFGGGLFHSMTSGVGSVKLIRCRLVGNDAVDGDGFTGNGGGAALLGTGSALLLHCEFIDNTALSFGLGGGTGGGNGGGLYLTGDGEPILANCLFRGNSASIQNPIFAAGGRGGAVLDAAGSQAVHCTVVDNSAQSGPAPVDSHGFYYTSDAAPSLTNCILWGNGGGSELDQVNAAGAGVPIVNFNCIEGYAGAWGGVGNIAADPTFADADLRLAQGSPCVDAGANTVVGVAEDLDGFPRLVDDPAVADTGFGSSPVVDLGAYEYHDPSPLFVDVVALSIAAGGTQTLVLDAGPALADQTYFLVGSATGTTPGLLLAPGITLPLNPDPYFTLTLNMQGFLIDALGTLDDLGRATAAFDLPGGLALPQLTVHHAYAVFAQAGPTVAMASNAAMLELSP